MESGWLPNLLPTLQLLMGVQYSSLHVQEASTTGHDGCANLSLVCCHTARLMSELNTPHCLFPQHKNKSEALLHRC